MNQKVQTNTKPDKLEKKDINRAWFKWWVFAAVPTSTERLQALSFCASISPVLEKLYKTKESLSEALKRHLMFFNTQATWGSIIHGSVIALEEQKANGEDIPDVAITSLKTGLMGSMAGIGDTLDWCLLDPILLVIFLPLASAGNWLGAVLPLILFTIPTVMVSYKLWNTGYRIGRDSITMLLEGGKLNRVIVGASVLGLFMMGAISGNYVDITTPVSLNFGEQTFALQQEVFDNIFPGFLSLIAILAVYFYIEKVGPKYTRVLIGLTVIGIVLGYFGII